MPGPGHFSLCFMRPGTKLDKNAQTIIFRLKYQIPKSKLDKNAQTIIFKSSFIRLVPARQNSQGQMFGLNS